MLTLTNGSDALYVYDGLGNPLGVISDSSTTDYSYSYDPYGVQILNSTDGGNAEEANPYSFRGGIQGRASGLVKFALRWYDPTTGTWTRQDTLDAPLDPANANRCVYVGGDPVNGFDPTGRRSTYCTVTEGVGLLGAGVATGAAVYAVATAPADLIPVAGKANGGGAIAVAAIGGSVGFLGDAAAFLGGC